MSGKWTKQDMPDLTGKVVVVTGANSGLGFESSKAFATKGAHVVMTARSLEKGEKARTEILAEVPNATLDLMRLDVGDLSSVREFAAAFKAKYDRLDILLNNAGLMAIPRQETVDGFEMQIGVNHLGHFVLTGELIDLITRTPNARIHNVTSSANYMGAINFDDLMGEQSYSRWGAYGQSKLANIYFTYELQKRLAAAGHDTIANVSHPGLVIGNLQANSMANSGTGGSKSWMYRLMGPLMGQDISMGVLPMLYAMTAAEAEGGVMYAPRWLGHRGYPAKSNPNNTCNDEEAVRSLWDISEELTGMHYLNGANGKNG